MTDLRGAAAPHYSGKVRSGVAQVRLFAPVTLVVAALAALVISALAVGTFAGTGLIDAGPMVRWSRPVVIVGTELAAATTIGCLVAALFLVPPVSVPVMTRLGSFAAGTWTVLAVTRLVLTYADLAGTTLDHESFGPGFFDFAAHIGVGQGLTAISVVAAVVTVLITVARRPAPLAWTAVAACVALGAQAQIGHAAGAANHNLAVSSMFGHLVGVTGWIGTLLALVLVKLGPDLPVAVRRYSPVAAWCALMVLVSGIAGTVLRVGTVSELGTRYGLLIVAKSAATALLLGLGWVHRTRTLPALDTRPRLFYRIALVEFAVMGLASGLAVTLANTAPPIPQEAPTGVLTAAQRVTRELLPPEPTIADWFTQGRPDVLFAFLAIAAGVVYSRWAARLRRRGDAWPMLRQVSWLSGLAVFIWATSGGPALYGKVLFSAHMIEHMLLVMVVPVFLALAAPVTLALRALPVRHDGSRGPREWILAIVHSRPGKLFAHPIFAAVNFAGSMVVFYFSPAFEFALRNHLGHVAMIVHFTLAGYLFVNAMIGIDPGPKRPGYPMRLVLLFATMAFHAFFGVAIMSSNALLAADWFGLLGRPWGPTALADQQIGGAITWGIGELPTLAIAVALAVAWARSDRKEAVRRDRSAVRSHDAELVAYNERLAALSRRDESERA